MRKGFSLTIALTVFCVALLITTSRSHVAASDCSKTSVGFIPLNELGPGLYRTKQGGLYPSGSNLRPVADEDAGVQIAKSIVPLNAGGQPDPNGRIVLLSIGMSNTTQEFSAFIAVANPDAAKNPSLTLVDGAQGGMSADRIVDLSTTSAQQFWQTVDQRLSAAGVTPAQVQIAWVKQADPGPTLVFPDDALKLKGELTTIAQILKTRFPNIKIAYYSSRIYAGYATSNLNPEPFAYQSGFAVKWLIEDQINGSADLNFDSARGAVRSPWLAWGPYLWADGLTARGDGLIWACSDFQSDGTHPATPGAREKVANMLLTFFKNDSTAWRWFVNPPSRTNPIDQTDFFVRQQYLDFLNREPDPPGFAAWQAVINNCASGDTNCDRVHVSEAFYKSPEFAERGYFVYRFYPVSFGRKPDYAEFIRDLPRVSGFLTTDQLEAAKVAFINDVMARSAFVTKYNSLDNTNYVNTLLGTAGVTSANRQPWIEALNGGTKTRAQVLREIVESSEVYQKYYNQAFVVMQYFGYLHRDPDALYLNWIQVLDGGASSRDMVSGFANSAEYRLRFGWQ